jgi:parvulin-like peptidyl-prolyl isomerase
VAKKKLERPTRQLTRRQLSRWQQQHKRQRIITIAGISIISAVLALLVSGWYINEFRPLHQKVIRVNETEFNMDYYVKMLRVFGEGQPGYYLTSVADEVVNIIQRNELVRQGAEREFDITVGQAAIDEEIKKQDPPLSKDYHELVRAQLLLTKLRDEYFEKQIPVNAEQKQVMVMLLENKSQADQTRDRIEAGEDFGQLASELSLQSISDNGSLGWLTREIMDLRLGTSIPGDFVFNADAGALSQPLHDDQATKNIGYWLIEVLDRQVEEEEEANVQAILLGDEKEAQEVKDRLDAGEEFDALAKEFSQLDGAERDGGYLGLLTPGIMTAAFDKVVFEDKLQPRYLSQPVRDEEIATKGGYWLINILDEDADRQINEEDRKLLIQKALTDWVVEIQDDPDNVVESYLDDDKKAWAVNRVLKG